MEIVPFQASYLPEAAALFVESFKRLRVQVSALPKVMEDAGQVMARLETLVEGGCAALEHGELIGYLSAYVFDHFRDTERKGAFCPEWGHAAQETAKPAIYRALYRGAAARWAGQGCSVHAISLLAHDSAAREVWFWQGFGLAVVDAIRPITPLENAAPDGLTIRQAAPDDAAQLAMLDTVNRQHYVESPIFMAPRKPCDTAGFRTLISDPVNSVWLVLDGGDPVGFMQFERRNHGAADIVSADATITITAAYVDPAYRGRGAGKGLLNVALRHYAGRGCTQCAVDFESYNPEAAVFWTKYFMPVCLSVMRVPEAAGA